MANLESRMYRRGLTLGLTMAEIFMLILFLFLLTFLGFYREHEQTKGELEDVESELTKIQDEYEERAAQPGEIQRLNREKLKLKQTISRIGEENTIIKDLLQKSDEKRKRVEKSLAEERKGLPKEVQDLVEKIDSLESDLFAAKGEFDNNMAQLEAAREENFRLRDLLHPSKGVDPPCWYEVVTRKGKRHEKPHILLDVAVHDEYIRIRVNENVPLQGRAIDEHGQPAPTSYAEEYNKLPLDHLTAVAEKRMSLVEFQEIAEPVKHMGKDEQIRDYACVFYAKIWDHTSPTAKKRWQQAREKIEDFFYPLFIRNDPWE